MKGSRITYSVNELTWIKLHCTDDRKQAHAEFCEKFGRSDISLQNFKALCKRRGWLTGRTGTFPAGHAPANKGKTMPWHPNSARTRFQKGQLPHNTKFVGHERVTKDGYIEISVEQQNPHTGYERRYVQKHRYLWEQANEPVPDGMFLKCLDGNRQNTDPENWQALPRAAQVYLGGFRGIDYEAAAPDVRPAIIAFAKLKCAVRSVRIQSAEASRNGGAE